MTIPRRRFLELGAAAALAGCAAPGAGARPPRVPLAPLGGKIEHFIVLMLENRSFDLMLGSLPGEEYDGLPRGTRLAYSQRNGGPEWIEVEHGAPPDCFAPDPGHGFHAVEAQIQGAGLDKPADMAGFAERYRADHPRVDRAKMQQYLTLYGEGRLPVLQRLAKQFGVCTHWFCSLPASTAPNRMFAHAGTSGGATGVGAYYTCIGGRMIFDLLGTSDPQSWRVYFHDMPHLWLSGDAWTKTFSGHLHFMGAFEHDVRADRLATYTFIEPQHVIPPWSSQHPSAGVSHGERLIAAIYDTLASEPRVFEKSLLLIVYDEHGGFYDHVIPPGHPGWEAQCPGIDYKVVTPDYARGKGAGRENGYAFDTLGPRVPAVVVSPWIERSSVFGWRAPDPAKRVTFDHTSILATVGAMTGVWVESRRARAATGLAVTLNRDTPRNDYPPRLEYDPNAYRRSGVDPERPDGAAQEAHDAGDGGVARELLDAYRAEHGIDASPHELVEHYRSLLGG